MQSRRRGRDKPTYLSAYPRLKLLLESSSSSPLPKGRAYGRAAKA